MIHLCAFFLPAVPLLLLLAFLVLGRYPGHEAIVRLSERLAARGRRRGTATASRRPLRPPTRAASGGLLLALALSGRAPPASPST
ncbi:MAG TPA: hypothetical protein VG458_00595 [Solirubrobacterales bacterium]|nr:hypothetical protein [Solirubrobacterales bacterium]